MLQAFEYEQTRWCYKSLWIASEKFSSRSKNLSHGMNTRLWLITMCTCRRSYQQLWMSEKCFSWVHLACWTSGISLRMKLWLQRQYLSESFWILQTLQLVMKTVNDSCLFVQNHFSESSSLFSSFSNHKIMHLFYFLKFPRTFLSASTFPEKRNSFSESLNKLLKL